MSKSIFVFYNKEYSDTLHVIGITPVVAPQEAGDNKAWKDNIRFLCNKQVVDVTIKMDFESYYKADSFGKAEQTKELILTAVKRIKSKGKFDYDRFK